MHPTDEFRFTHGNIVIVEDNARSHQLIKNTSSRSTTTRIATATTRRIGDVDDTAYQCCSLRPYLLRHRSPTYDRWGNGGAVNYNNAALSAAVSRTYNHNLSNDGGALQGGIPDDKKKGSTINGSQNIKYNNTTAATMPQKPLRSLD